MKNIKSIVVALWRNDVRNIKLLLASVVFGFSALSFIASSSHAALITYNFTGTTNTIVTGTPLEGTFSFGQSVSGSFVLDTSVPDSNGDPNFGDFAGAITSISVTIGSYSASATGGAAFTRNEFPDDDLVEISAFINVGQFAGSASVSSPSVGGLDLGGLLLVLQDSTLTALASDALPSPISLTDFDSVFGLLEFFDPLDLEAEIVSLAFNLDTLETVTVLSTDGSLALFGLGLLTVALVRRRKIRR